ncbi:diacylglycerol/lipid kinase family protein [Lactobacillus acetotolerans]|jgi:YegS/Rv2252/BmrU family lipid kinase|uniref:Diacylglycerol kinase family lipid kinase n=3 Tax=Lactobacillus acetotolerans TaxID=1600 RepID=A0A0D6A4J6_9LACO|nr:diacylglycerol kinase family protein [Lactobacillus acetotolerans]KRN42045.1 transcriptional regulator [Lactobacillus acetotolerans DSM 20749 = JCM 3825]QFG51402.1 diacylglycerol kinase family lipid kinase [Lactobacillus acetotolerans]QGV04485.1 YegS/Rv2252/BmrU family lipid kinase [Lactobacillus acetotolerans]BAQ57390.1 transcriptional regulator [Lactobacillus acetotolerans]GGV08282.1 transcriptional regulator [Lactobacillus acetotolerans DSM 20749 = JCM 3825]
MDNKIKIHLLVNEIAGNGNAKKAFKKITSLLIKENIDFSFQKSNYAGELINLAKEYANRKHSDNEVLLVIGGDGSLNEVLNGIKRSTCPDTPISYLPSGTGNDFGRASGLTNKPEKLLDNLKNNLTPKRADCGSFKFPGHPQNTYYFANNFGIGFDAYVVQRSNKAKLKKFLNAIKSGKLIYAFNVINALKNQDTFSVDIQSKGKSFHYDDAYFVTTTNHPYFGGGIPILPEANIYSRKLDTVVVEKPNLRKFIKLFLHLFKDGSHINDPQFHYVEAEKIHVKTQRPEFAQVDGEVIPKRPFGVNFAVKHFNLLI